MRKFFIYLIFFFLLQDRNCTLAYVCETLSWRLESQSFTLYKHLYL